MQVLFLQAKVTGSTLNGKKERMQAEEGDKEKWDFLSFAETWAPNESLEDTKNEVLFTHVRLKLMFFSILSFQKNIITIAYLSFVCTADFTSRETLHEWDKYNMGSISKS